MDPTIYFLISKLIQLHCFAWCGSNKAVSLSLKRHYTGSVASTFQVCYADGFRLTSHLGNLRFHGTCSDWLHVASFSVLFSKLSV